MQLRRILLPLCIAALMGVTALCLHEERQDRLTAQLLAFQAAYADLAKLPDFECVSVQPDGSVLLHSPGMPDQSGALPSAIADMLRDRSLLGLRKRGDDVFFITRGTVDDEWGYAVTDDDAVHMDGLWHLDRIDGSIYSFSTMK